MKKPLKIGVTGGIGSGKSLVCKLFTLMGVPVYYADDRAKAILLENASVREKIIQLFGEKSYENGQVNRAYLAECVFNDEEKLKQMNAVVHPAVADDFDLFVQNHHQHSLILKEAALLFETGSFRSLDKNIAVLADKEVRTRRVLLRDVQRSEEQIEQIMSKQTTDAQRRKHADILVFNNGDQLLIPQVMEIYKELRKLAGN